MRVRGELVAREEGARVRVRVRVRVLGLPVRKVLWLDLM